ncbi:MAG: NAD(P)H-dependent oxidoreductase subunit E, partial [Thermogutta sp.]|uniref:NAD(P)H-dependent oxidoreductase subunit E n=1 Tax=Thermogutta sp. TaxID=1962930 RepID=UPI0019B4DB6F
MKKANVVSLSSAVSARGSVCQQSSIDLRVVDEIVERCGRGPEAAIPILQAIQSHFRYLPQEALERVCELTQVRPAQLIG